MAHQMEEKRRRKGVKKRAVMLERGRGAGKRTKLSAKVVVRVA